MATVQALLTLRLLQLPFLRPKPSLSTHPNKYRNLKTYLRDPTAVLPSEYEGYASCPLFTGDGKLMLAEFKYGGIVDETFFNDQ